MSFFFSSPYVRTAYQCFVIRLVGYAQEREFERSRLVLKDIVNTGNELVASADKALEMIRRKTDGFY